MLALTVPEPNKAVFASKESMAEQLPKLITIVGTTASGKTDWSLRISKLIGGGIISADSRQMYKKMSIGTAKPSGEWRWVAGGLSTFPHKAYFIEDIPHYLIDILDPGKMFTAAEFRDKAIKYIKLARRNGRVPMLVGGTGLYVSSVVDNLHIPRIQPNKKLRESLEGKPAEELMALLRTLDPVSAGVIDAHNKRRIIRALEVCIFSGEKFSDLRRKGEPLFDTLMIGVSVQDDVLKARIRDRVRLMMAQGLLGEIQALLRQKYAWHLSSMSGIGYREFRPFVEKTATLEQVEDQILRNTWQYVRRQRVWFKRDTRIQWCATYEDAEKLVQDFLKK